MSYSLENQTCNLNGGIKYILLVDIKDVKVKDGQFAIKRKYGKFKRKIKKISNGEA
jgi:hypothetical protein